MNAPASQHSIRIRGDYALFTRPEFKAERISYEVLTPSAARGVLEAILWKPAIFWHVRRIALLAPIRFAQFRRNEVKSRILTASARSAARNGVLPRDFYADEDRAQRNTLALRDVDYAVEAEILMTSKRGQDDNPRKFDEMFRRRLVRGQFHMQPYLGCREFPARVEPYNGDPLPVAEENRGLGLMLHDIRFKEKANEAVFFEARLDKGVINVPAWEIL